MKPPKISIIILQYNNSEDTLKCLESIKEQSYANFNVTIVDNASSIEHVNSVRFFVEQERKINPNAEYQTINIESNLGYAGGNNVGIKYALEHGNQYVLILNPDITLEKDSVSKLVDVGESDRKIGIIGHAIDEGNGKIICGGKIKFYQPTLQHVECQNFLDSNSRFYILDSKFYVPGACMLISKSVIELVGMFDERYFLYFEDADLCFRTRKAGWKLAVIPEELAHHQPSSSTKKLGVPLLLRYHYRNAHLFVLKNEKCLCKYIMLPLWSAWIIIKQVAKILLWPEKREVSRAILSGVLDFYKGNFGHLK